MPYGALVVTLWTCFGALKIVLLLLSVLTISTIPTATTGATTILTTKVQIII